jgi:NAD(P)-dependent dehydrogenase (short-subunit alcohol dehydrogenase family)
MMKGTLLVIGAGGDVGQGIVAAALASGRRVVAAGRDAKNLLPLAACHVGKQLACVAGDVSSEAGAAGLWEEAQNPFGGIRDVVISVNLPTRPRPLMEWSAEALSAQLAANLLTHFNALKTFRPRMAQEGMLLGIGGGTADFILPQMAHASMAQAALRNLYRGFARECRTGPAIRELMIVSMVNGRSSRARAKPDWLIDDEIGRHVCAILDAPEQFPEAILQLKARSQVGQPDKPAERSGAPAITQQGA